MTHSWLRRTAVRAGLACLLLSAGLAEMSGQNVALEGMLREHNNTKEKVLTAARKTPESLLDYQPTKEVFTLRRMYLHVAGAAYNICSSFQGKYGTAPKVDVNKKAAKAEVLATLEAAFSYCDAATAGVTDAALSEMVTNNNRQLPRSYHLSHLIGHTNLHYGNIVTYLRMNGLSPGE